MLIVVVVTGIISVWCVMASGAEVLTEEHMGTIVGHATDRCRKSIACNVATCTNTGGGSTSCSNSTSWPFCTDVNDPNKSCEGDPQLQVNCGRLLTFSQEGCQGSVVEDPNSTCSANQASAIGNDDC